MANPNDWSDWYDETFNKKPPPPPPPSNVIPIMGNGDGRRDRAYALAGLQRECAALAAMPPDSGRNNTLNNAVYSLAGFITTGFLSEDELVDALTAAALTSGLTASETAATIRSALSGARTNGNARTAPPRDPTRIPAASPGVSSDNPDSPPPIETANGNAVIDDIADDPKVTLEDIEEDFWTARPELELIYTAALAQMASPWAVLACCVARLLCLIPPAVTLPPIIGSKGSLNWFTALTAKSGGGKGAAMSVARELVPTEILVRPIGSGEGMAECYNRKPRKAKKDEDPATINDRPITSVLFDVAEVDSLGALGSRTGQTTLAIVRQGFSGETLGYSYRGRQDEQVPAHTYRMTLIVAVQPMRAGILLNDGGGGIPQRFMWFPARDRRITADVPQWPLDDLDRPRILQTISAREMANAAGDVSVPREVWDEIREARAASMRDDDNALDGHALFCREKLAYALAYMNARTVMDMEDWRLAGIASAVSDWMRDKAIEAYRESIENESRERGRLRGLESAALEAGKVREQMDRPTRVVRWVLNTIMKAGLDGITNRELRRKANSRDKDLLPGAIQYLVDAGRIEQIEGTTTWTIC